MYYRDFCPGAVELRRRFERLNRLYGYDDDETRRNLKELIYFEAKAGSCQLSCVECLGQSVLLNTVKIDFSDIL